MPEGEKPVAFGPPVPELPVADVVRAQRHYRDALGFTVAWLEPDAGMGAVSRGKVAVFFRRRTPPFEPAVHWVYVPELDALYAELVSRGAKLAGPPEKKPWGLWQFTLTDLDGNVFHFHHD